MIELSDITYVNAYLQNQIKDKIMEVIDSNLFVDSHYVVDFEKAFSNFLNVNNCVSVGNGTDAIEIAINSLSLPAFSEIIVPDCTFIATVEAIINSGHIPVIADVRDDFTINPDSIKKLITERTRAIICVHLYGNPCDMNEIAKIAQENNLYLIEDAAQAHGTCYDGRLVGGFSDLSCFSFYPSKVLGAFGDAGAIATNSDKLAKKIREHRNHGRQERKMHVSFGRNSKMDSIQAIVLSEKLKHLDFLIENRRKNAKIYDMELSQCEFISLVPSLGESSYYQYVICSDYRDKIVSYLYDLGVQCGVYYKNTISQLPFFDNNCKAYKSRELFSKVLSLPIGLHVDEMKQQYIIDKIKAFCP